MACSGTKRVVFALIALALAVVTSQAATVPAAASRASVKYERLPLNFEVNRGQAASDVHFVSRGQGYTLLLADNFAVLSLSKANSAKSSKNDEIRMRFSGANPTPQVSGDSPLAGIANYFIGNDPSRWRQAIPTFGKVRYQAVYPGIDLVFYGNQHQLEYDFVVASKANPGAIRLSVNGARRLHLQPNGDLSILTKNGSIMFQRPIVYQDTDGQRTQVEGRFAILAKNTFGFSLGAYDHTRPLTIDPTLAYSTYLGGSGTGDGAAGVAVDALGFAYLTGSTNSIDFPTTPSSHEPIGTVVNSGAPITNAFITKMTPDGSALVYSTYVSGAHYYGRYCVNGYYGGGDFATSIAIDPYGAAYVTGCTTAYDFPTTAGAYQPGIRGSQDAFIVKLSADGSKLVYSTLLGGSSYSTANAIALDSQNNAYIGGATLSDDFPTFPGSFRTVRGGGRAFVSKLNSTGTHLLYSTFLGGNSQDDVVGLAVDPFGSAYAIGNTASKSFPTTPGAFQPTNNETTATGTCPYVAKLTPDGSALAYSTYLGGTGGDGVNDGARGIAVDVFGHAFITGFAGSANFPTTQSSFQPKNATHTTYGVNAFVTELNLTGADLIYSTFLGGSAADSASAIALDASGNVYVTGNAHSTNFPISTTAFQKTLGPNGSNAGNPAFLAQLSPDGSHLLYSSFIGGSAHDYGNTVAVDPFGNAYIAGSAGSTNFPTTSGAFQRVNKSQYFGLDGNAFVAKFLLAPANITSTTLVSDGNPQVFGTKITFTAYVQVTSGSGMPGGSVTFTVDGTAITPVTLDSNGHAVFSTNTLSIGSHTISASYLGDSNDSPSNSTPVTQVVSGKTQTINFTGLPTTAVYGQAGPYTLSATATSGLPVSYAVSGPATLSGSLLTITGAGTVLITASQPGDSTYTAATPVTQSIVVTQPIIQTGTVQLLASVMLSVQPGGGYKSTITVANNGTGTAQQVILTTTSIGSALGTPAPQSLGNIAPGASVTATVTLPSTAGVSGIRIIDKITGTYMGGTFGASYRMTLP